MGIVHVVCEGEHLSSIAARYQFRDYRTIWDHAANTKLKTLRANPNVLFPGDRLYIPEKLPKILTAITGRQHVFRVNKRRLILRVQLLQRYAEPLSQTSCDLAVASDTVRLKSDKCGTVEHEIPATAREANLGIHEQIAMRAGVQELVLDVPIVIGDLDPVVERSGQQARLSNLGYYSRSVGDSDDQEFRSAVEEFQCEHGLAVDGICGSMTQAKLLEVYGC